MNYKIITPVAEAGEPVSLKEANLQLKIGTGPDDMAVYPTDAAVQDMIPAAREFCEHYTGRALAVRTLEVALDAFPGDSCAIELPMSPATSITSVKYTDTDGAEQTLPDTKYALSAYGLSRNLAPKFG